MLEKAKLVEIEQFTTREQARKAPGGKEVIVQFNPESLKVSMSNQNTGGNQPGGGSSRQFAGSGTSKLTVELLFDTSDTERDVRKKTEEVAYFVMAKESRGQRNNRVPPRVRFQWGSFVFEGVVDSLDETLEYFSEEGIPLRATVSLALSRDDIAFVFGKSAPGRSRPGTDEGQAPAGPQSAARPGESLQELAARDGQSDDWRAIAEANDIDDPLRLEPGTLVDLNAGAQAGVSASAGAAAGLGGSLGSGGAAGFSAGLGAGAGFGASAGASAGFSAGAGAGMAGGIGAGAGLGGSAGAGIGGTAGIGGGVGAAAGVGGGLQAGIEVGGAASAGAVLGAGASAGISGSAGAVAGGGFGLGVDVVEE